MNMHYNKYVKICLIILSFVSFFSLTNVTYAKNLVILPLLVDAKQLETNLDAGLRNMLVSRLSIEGINIMETEEILPVLNEKEIRGVISKQRAEILAKKLKADFIIYGSITSIGTVISLDIYFLNLSKGTSELTAVSEIVDKEQLVHKWADIAQRFRSRIENVDKTKKREAALSNKNSETKNRDNDKISKFILKDSDEYKPVVNLTTDIPIMAFGTGDIDGDGVSELIIIGRKRLSIYKKKGDGYFLLGQMRAKSAEVFLNVSIGDIDRKGKDKIFLVSSYGMYAETSVWEWNGSLKTLYQQKGHLRITNDVESKKSILLFQDSNSDKFFDGRICIMNFTAQKKFVCEESLPELKGVQFYTLRLLNIKNEEKGMFLGLGEDSHLHRWDNQGKLLWKDEKRLGGTNNNIRLGEVILPDSLPPMIFINSRISIMDFDGDGEKEVLVINNLPLVEYLSNVKLYNKSKLVAFRLKDNKLLPLWTSKELEFSITDLQEENRSLLLSAQHMDIKNILGGNKEEGFIISIQ